MPLGWILDPQHACNLGARVFTLVKRAHISGAHRCSANANRERLSHKGYVNTTRVSCVGQRDGARESAVDRQVLP